AVAILERNGIEVVVPHQQCCGIPAVVNSNMDLARRYGQQNVRRLTPVAEEMDIVASSTSCGLMLKHDYGHLLDIPGSERLGAKTYDIMEYLWMLHEAGELDTDFQTVPMRLLYHAPCHLKSHGIGYPAMRLLRLIPGVKLEEVDEGCCGISGTFGVKVEKYDLSMKIGRRLFEAVKAAGSDYVLADLGSAGLSTQMAIEQLSDGNGRVLLSNAPFVEGAVIAAVEASIESDLEAVAAAALGAREMEKVSGQDG